MFTMPEEIKDRISAEVGNNKNVSNGNSEIKKYSHKIKYKGRCI